MPVSVAPMDDEDEDSYDDYYDDEEEEAAQLAEGLGFALLS